MNRPPPNSLSNASSRASSSHSSNPNTHHRPLLPAPPQSDSSRSSSSITASNIVIPPKRQPSASACDLCRRKKTKCDNRRPSCGRCLMLDTACSYDTDLNETSAQALRRRFAGTEKELAELKELFHYLRESPADEAVKILSRLRVSDDWLEVLQSVRGADVLRSVRPSSSSWESPNSTRQNLDAGPTPARFVANPWTGLVGDAIVSELIDFFFSRDNSYLIPMLDRDAFLQDIRGSNPATARYCSPLLVNSICAVTCCLDPRRSQTLSHLFMNESKRLLDLEQGRASLPTSVALYLLYLTSALLGKDRAGLHFRHMSVDTMSRLRLEKEYSKIENGAADKDKTKFCISRALWGLFIAETRVGWLYGQVSLAPPPSIPLPSLEPPDSNRQRDNNFATDSSHAIMSIQRLVAPPIDIFHVASYLAKLQHSLQIHNTRSMLLPGSDEDVQKRVALLSEIRGFWQSQKWHEIGLSHEACCLSLHFTEVLLSVLQALPLDLVIPNPQSPDGNQATTVQDLYLFHAKSTLDTINTLTQREEPEPPSYLMGLAIYHCLVVLIPSLVPLSASSNDVTLQQFEVQDVFNTGCDIFCRWAQSLPLFGRLSQAIAALVWKLGKKMPTHAKSCIQRLEYSHEEVTDIPISFAVPRLRDVSQHLSSDDMDAGLGALILDWLRSYSGSDGACGRRS